MKFYQLLMRFKKEKIEMIKSNPVKKDFSEVPRNTLKLIEKAENN